MKELQIIESDKAGIHKRLKTNKEKKNNLHFVNKKLLGRDCNKANYFFFKSIKDKIFVRVKEEPEVIEVKEVESKEVVSKVEEVKDVKMKEDKKDDKKDDKKEDKKEDINVINEEEVKVEEDKIEKVKGVKIDVNSKKLVIQSKNPTQISYSWFYYSLEDVKLITNSKLYEKANDETNLINQIKMLYKKNLLKVKKPEKNTEDTESSSDEDDKTAFDNYDSVLETLKSWKNKYLTTNKSDNETSNEKNEEKDKERLGNQNTTIKQEPNKNTTINKIILTIEEKFSDYLESYDKEWESETIMKNFRTFLSKCKYRHNFVTSLIILNERFKNPYKTQEEEDNINANSKDSKKNPELLNNNYYLTDEKENGLKELVIFKSNKNKTNASKVKIWNKDMDNLGIEEYFLNYIAEVKAYPGIYLSAKFYEGLIFSLIKKREYYNRRTKNDTEVNDDPEPSAEVLEIQKNIEEKLTKDDKTRKKYYELGLGPNVIEDMNLDRTKRQTRNKKKLGEQEDTESTITVNTPPEEYEKIEIEEEDEPKKKVVTETKEIKGAYKETKFSNEDKDCNIELNIDIDNIDNVSKGVKKRGRKPKTATSMKEVKQEPETVVVNINESKKLYSQRTNKYSKGKECYICNTKGDNMLCCEKCDKCAHKFCLCLKKIPEYWICDNCI